MLCVCRYIFHLQSPPKSASCPDKTTTCFLPAKARATKNQNYNKQKLLQMFNKMFTKAGEICKILEHDG